MNLQVCDCQWHDQDHRTNSRECVCSDREISEDQHVLWLRRFHHRLHINPQVLQVFKRQTNWGSKDNHSSAGCSASKRRSNRSQPQSSFASSDSQHLSLSLSSSLAHSAASSSLFWAQTSATSSTSTTPSRTPWRWPLESSTLAPSGQQMRVQHGFSLLSQVSSLQFEFLL